MAVARASIDADPVAPLLARLNPAQQEAVTASDAALLVYAGAGTGKTRVLTHRIAYLIAAQGVPPSGILATTFTRKAAAELRIRLGQMVPAGGPAITAGTFNSIGFKFLRYFRRYALQGLEVCEPSAQLAVLGQIRKDLGLRSEDYPAEILRAVIGRLKADAMTLDRYVAFCKTAEGGDEDEQIREVYRRYQGTLRARGMIDFDDQVLETTALFRRESGVLAAVRAQFRYLFVDEFQDINRAQWELIKVLAGDPEDGDAAHLCFVGDDDQSIYSFRGAHPGFVGEFTQRYQPRTILLNDNYRSGAAILEVANKLLAGKNWGHAKSLQATVGDGVKPAMVLGMDPEDEAAKIGDRIDVLRQNGVPLREIAILYRQNSQSRPFEEILHRRKVEHIVVGGVGFYQRPEVQQALAFLRLGWDDADHEALTLIAPVTLRYLKREVRTEFLHAIEQRGLGVLELPKQLASLPELPIYGQRAVRELVDLVKHLHARRRLDPLPVLLDEAIVRGGLGKMLDQATRSEDGDRRENLDELRAALASFAAANPGAGPAEFLGEVQGERDPRRNEETAEGVRLMTLHKAKGLEFRAVFVAGLEEKRLPHARAIEEGSINEELRLLYVGVTRAKEHLTLSACEVRYGGQQEIPRTVLPSRFLQQLTVEHVEGEAESVAHLLGLVTKASAAERMVARAVADSEAAVQSTTTQPKRPRRAKQPDRGPHPPSAYQVGDAVIHGLWGQGTVTGITAAPGIDHHLTIEFRSGNIRRVSERVAPLIRQTVDG